MSKSNTVNKERNKIRKGAGAVSTKYNKKKAAKPKSSSSKTYEFSSSDGEYIVTEASDNGDDNDLYEKDQDGDTFDLEIGAHYRKPFLLIMKRNHVPTVGLM